jgi:hypothetical protein
MIFTTQLKSHVLEYNMSRAHPIASLCFVGFGACLCFSCEFCKTISKIINASVVSTWMAPREEGNSRFYRNITQTRSIMAREVCCISFKLAAVHLLVTLSRFVAISAGTDHLLALTSSGRAFAHPISTQANTYGQLGFRKFDIPTQSSGDILSHSRLAVELTPKIITDPYAKTSAFNRPETPSSDTPKTFDDENIRFSDTLFEIPGLRGIKVAQAVAAGRTSFVRTDSGKVLGWGANENA